MGIVKFREHRGGLSASMETVIELKDRAALIAHIKKMLAAFYFGGDIEAGLKVEKYVYDERIGWNTHIVTLEGYGVLGFTDGPCPAV